MTMTSSFRPQRNAFLIEDVHFHHAISGRPARRLVYVMPPRHSPLSTGGTHLEVTLVLAG